MLKEANFKTSMFFLDALSMATALDDFVAPDCRFINIKRGQTVYVYSKLLPAEGAGVFWSGSVCARFYLYVLDSQCPICTRNTFGSMSLLHMRRPSCVFPEHNRLQTTSAHASTIFDYISIFLKFVFTLAST